MRKPENCGAFDLLLSIGLNSYEVFVWAFRAKERNSQNSTETTSMKNRIEVWSDDQGPRRVLTCLGND